MSWPWSFPKPLTPEVDVPGEGKWWGPLLRRNLLGDTVAHPYRCAVPTCNQLYSKSGASATRVRNHMTRKGGGIAGCIAAKESDRVEALKYDSSHQAAAKAQPPASDNRAAAEAAAGLAPMTSSSMAAGSSSGGRPELELTPKRQKILSDAREETIRNANLGGLFKHMMPKSEQDKLDLKWAAALANSCLPPNLLENPYVRDAIFSTSIATAPYYPPRRNVMERKLLPALDADLDILVQTTMKDAVCRTLGTDGWDDAQRRSLYNFMLFSEKGDEFIDNELMMGVDKSAPALAALAFKYVKWATVRYPPIDNQHPAVFGICTDNPTVMRLARQLLIDLILADAELSQKFFFDWPCLLHADSSLLGDVCKLPFIKKLLVKHKLIVTTFRNKQWLRFQLGAEQEKRKGVFKDRLGRYRPLTLIRYGDTRIGSVPRSAERNVKLRSALDGTVSHEDFFAKCGVSKGRAAAALEEEEDECESASECEGEDGSEGGNEGGGEEEDEEAEGEAGPATPSARRQQKYLDVREAIRSDVFWEDTEEVLCMLAPLLRDLKHADEDRPLMAFVWPMMLTLHRKAEAMLLPELPAKYDGRMPLHERKKFCSLIMDRWAYLHVPLHSAAYVLNPRFIALDHFSDPEVRDDFVSVLRSMLKDEARVSAALGEYNQYHNKVGPWSDSLIWMQAQELEPYEFWKQYGSNTVELAIIAPQILAAQHSASGGERNWSLQGRVNTKLRSRQKPATLARMTRLAANQKLMDRRKGRGLKEAAAILRINARRSGRPPPPCSAPRPYPLQDDADWQSCHESESDGADDDQLLGPRPELSVSRGRQIVRDQPDQ